MGIRLMRALVVATAMVLPACHLIAGYDQAPAVEDKDGGLEDGETAPLPPDGALDGVVDGASDDSALDSARRDSAGDTTPAEGPPDAAQQERAVPPLDLGIPPDALQALTATEWALTVGSRELDEGRGIAVDLYGNVYVAGQTGPSAKFDGQPLSASSRDAVLASADAEGTLRWAKSLGGIDPDNGTAVAVDAQGNIYITGSFQGSVDFGGGERTAVHLLDIFLASFRPDGVLRWSKGFGGVGSDIGYGLDVNVDGEVTLVGQIRGAVDFGGGQVAYTTGNDADAFVARFDRKGNHLWSKAFGGTGSDVAKGVATDSDGSTVVVGTYGQSLTFDNCSFPLASGLRVFVASVNKITWNCRWVRGFGNYTSQHAGNAIATDAAGDIYFTGAFRGDPTVAAEDVSCASSSSTTYDKVVVGSYTKDGAKRWATCAEDNNSDDQGTGIAIGPTGMVYATGYFSGTFNFGGTRNSTLGDQDIFLARLDAANGSVLGVEAYGGTANDSGEAVAVGSQGQILVAGTYRSDDWDYVVRLPQGGQGDLFFFSLSPP